MGNRCGEAKPKTEIEMLKSKVSYQKDFYEKRLEESRKGLRQVLNAAEMLWVVLANVSEGNWTKQTDDWQKAAKRWRDNYLKLLPVPEDLKVEQPIEQESKEKV